MKLRAQQTKARNEITVLADTTTKFQREIYKAEKELDIFNIQRQALEQESTRNLQDAAGREAELSNFDTLINSLQQRLTDAEKKLDELSDTDRQIQTEVQAADAELNHIKDFIIQDSRKLDARQNEYNLTKSLVDSLEGFPESIRFLKKHSEWATNAPLFSDILFCREDYRGSD